jgi:hypothetical protein
MDGLASQEKNPHLWGVGVVIRDGDPYRWGVGVVYGQAVDTGGG